MRVSVLLVRPMGVTVRDPSVGVLMRVSFGDHKSGSEYDKNEGAQQPQPGSLHKYG